MQYFSYLFFCWLCKYLLKLSLAKTSPLMLSQPIPSITWRLRSRIRRLFLQTNSVLSSLVNSLKITVLFLTIIFRKRLLSTWYCVSVVAKWNQPLLLLLKPTTWNSWFAVLAMLVTHWKLIIAVAASHLTSVPRRSLLKSDLLIFS